MITAICHCGAVRLEVARKPRSLTECTCSICRRYGARWAYYTRRTAKVLCAAGAVSAYAWGDKRLEFYHCNTCGCLTHYESTDKSEQGRIAVNARMFAPDELAGIRIRTFDGADTWKYLD